MTVIATHQLPEGYAGPDASQIYNALDCAVTFEVWEEIQSLFNAPPTTYTFERALQAPALEMMLRGFRVDQLEREKALVELRAKRAHLESRLQKMAEAVLEKPLDKSGRWVNPNSGDQLRALFYERMNIKPIESSIKGVRQARMDRETLEKLEVYFHPRPIIACILALRDNTSQTNVLTQGIDPDGRIRTSINVGATETGRFSSSKSVTGSGGNMFNITAELRSSFVADPGYKLVGIDLEQAESREVGFICGKLFNDWSYLDACEAGDLHTAVAQMVWPELGWTGELAADRAIADRPFYRQHSYRQTAKRGGHAGNYLVTPWTASRNLKCPIALMEMFLTRYMTRFACIPQWHRWVAEQLQTTHEITTVFGRSRHFFGRPNDDATLREAVAYEPQSATADRLNVGLMRIWTQLGSRVQVLLQLYDAIYLQIREDDDEEELVHILLDLLDVPIEHNGRRFTVPGEYKSGWNWADYSSTNPEGLKKWKGPDPRKRASFLDRVM